jgi:hypothetical protein
MVEYPDVLKMVKRGTPLKWPASKRRIPHNFTVNEPDASGQTHWRMAKVFMLVSPGMRCSIAIAGYLLVSCAFDKFGTLISKFVGNLFQESTTKTQFAK